MFDTRDTWSINFVYRYLRFVLWPIFIIWNALFEMLRNELAKGLFQSLSTRHYLAPNVRDRTCQETIEGYDHLLHV